MSIVPKFNEFAHATKEQKIDTKRMGVVLVGAFDDIKTKRQSRVGFGNNISTESQKITTTITDEEYIDFGVLPELIGRIAIKVTTNQLSDDEYVQIIYNPFSRVSLIIDTFKEFGIDLSGMVSENEIRALIKRSKSNRTGVRWVSSQVENKMLSVIRELGINVFNRDNKNSKDDIAEWHESNLSNDEPCENEKGDDSYDEFFF